jgi:crotonobetainyl-CoA:carnitine CoA-transferase CaiB-like acyl-CoA transferase
MMLEGIRVIDFTRYFPGPFATLRLQERGAQVIKVEDKKGDPARTMDLIDGEEGCVFRSMSWGKHCVSYDLKDEIDRVQVLKLIENADVVVESFRPGVTARLGIDYESVLKVNPKIVYVSLSGYGQEGSLSPLAGHDINYMAYSGVLDQLLDRGGRPIKPEIALADLVSGIVASEYILAGLVKVLKTGKGVYADVSMTEATLSILGLHVSWYSAHQEEHSLNNPFICYDVYETRDGRFVTLGALEEKFFRNFCEFVGRPDLIEYQNSPNSLENQQYLEMIKIFKDRSFEEWHEVARTVDCCLAPVLHVSELFKAPYVMEHHLIEEKWGMSYLTSCRKEGSRFLKGDKPYQAVGESNQKI